MVEGKGAWGGWAGPTKGEEGTGGSRAVAVQLWLRISPAAAASAAAFAAARRLRRCRRRFRELESKIHVICRLLYRNECLLFACIAT